MHLFEHDQSRVMEKIIIPSVELFSEYQNLIFVCKMMINSNCKNCASNYSKVNVTDNDSYNLRKKVPFEVD